MPRATTSNVYFVYVLESGADGNKYIGFTTNLRKRLEEHKKGLSFATKSRLSLNMVIGVGLTTVAIIFHITKISVSRWYNYMDISHTFMAVAVFIMIKGVLVEQKLNLEEA